MYFYLYSKLCTEIIFVKPLKIANLLPKSDNSCLSEKGLYLWLREASRLRRGHDLAFTSKPQAQNSRILSMILRKRAILQTLLLSEVKLAELRRT